MIPEAAAKLLAGLLFVFVVSCTHTTPPDTYEGRKITSLKVRFTGAAGADSPGLEKYITSRPGTAYSEAKVDADMKALCDSGLVTGDVRFLAEETKGGLGLIVEVTRLVMRPCTLHFVGNNSFSDQKLGKVSELGSEQATKLELDAAAGKIEAFYRRYGYIGVRVSHKNRASGDFYFIIEEGPKAR